MDYFGGLTFGAQAYVPCCRAWIERDFEYYALNFCRSGRILWAMGQTPLRYLNGPVAWWTVPQSEPSASEPHPAPYYFYGAAENEHWEHFYVTFSGPRAAAMRNSALIPAALDTLHFSPLADGESFAQNFFALLRTLERDGPHSPQATYQLEGLFLTLHTQSPPAALLLPVEIQAQAWLEAIRTAPHAKWDLDEQAQEMAVSTGHLRRVVTRLAGVSPHRFILDRRLDGAATRLRASNLPIKTIVRESGFEDVAHFTRLFTRRYGISPAAYRRETQMLGDLAADKRAGTR